MPTTFSQQHFDPSYESKPPSRLPLSAVIWIPLAILFAAGIVYAANYGYERATGELGELADPTAENETFSEPFMLDPGDEAVTLAAEKEALSARSAPPPGSVGSSVIVITEPLQLRIIGRDSSLAHVIVIGGRLDGQRFWTRADRLIKAKRDAR